VQEFQGILIFYYPCEIIIIIIIKFCQGDIPMVKVLGVNRPGDLTLKRSGQAGSKGRALLFLVSKQNLNPSY
jgi:hypothetical protein